MAAQYLFPLWYYPTKKSTKVKKVRLNCLHAGRVVSCPECFANESEKGAQPIEPSRERDGAGG